MEYDISIHLPQQVENFNQAYAQGDPEALERIKQNIMRLIPDGGFHKDMMEYEATRKKRIEQLMDDAIKTIRNTTENASGEKTLLSINDTQKQLGDALNSVESEYWDTIGMYMISWLNEQQEQPNEE